MTGSTRVRAQLLTFGLLAFLGGVGVASIAEWPRAGEARPQPAAPGDAAVPRPREVRQAVQLSDAFIAIAEAVTPAVVRIQAEHTARRPGGLQELFGGQDAPPSVPHTAGGTGFIVAADGYILTNNHVVEGADRIHVSLVDKRVLAAEVVGRDPTTDVAVLRVRAEGLPTVRLGDSEQARVGEWVLAIGNPGFESSSLDFTVTSGIISAKGRPLNIINQELLVQRDPAAAYAIEDFLQTDAVINPGNSGGPLVNLRGEVIGINTAIASTTGFNQGYGFAIPSNLARRVMGDLVEHGHVRRALLGVSIVDVTAEDAEVYGLPGIAGVLVEDFAGDSPAQAAGLARADVIVRVAGQPVERVGQLQRLIADQRPGEQVEVAVVRFGREHRFQVRLAEAEIPPPAARPARAPTGARHLGLEVSDLTQAGARRFGLKDGGRALVVRVDPASPAERKRIRPGDRVVEVNRRAVSSAREVQAVLRRARSGDVISLLLEADDGRTRIANLRVP
jgi:serine protease Do